MDPVCNHYGKKLLDLCKHCNIFILNGRAGTDKEIGKLTCKNTSIVDYCIGNLEFLKLVSEFLILDYSTILSDVHNPLAVCLCTNSLKEANSEQGVNDIELVREIPGRWDDSCKDLFINNILNQEREIENIIDRLKHDSRDDMSFVNEIIMELCDIFTESAKMSFGVKKENNEFNLKKNSFKKPWFTKDCKSARQNYRKAKRLYKKFGGEVFKEDLYVMEKMYKKTLNVAVKQHRVDMKQKLNNIRTKNPKEYWKIINSGRKRSSCKASINDLFEYFNSCFNNEFEGDVNHVLPLETIRELSEMQGNTFINDNISADEILKCVKLLKNNKTCGEDLLYNEYISSTIHIMMPLCVELFNWIFNTGNVPELWLRGNIVPVYKNKGDNDDAKNYRPITLISCLGKFFTSVINERLNRYADNVELILENQAGFRKNHSTVDHIFALNSLIELSHRFHKKMYCAFIDFEKACDTVWRLGLWNKLISNNINGKCFNVIVNMYRGIKSRIVKNNTFSDYFYCNSGVRQGENLSPFLFSLFLNDLESYLQSYNVKGLSEMSKKLERELQIYLKLFILLYADDTILLSETREDLQNQLDVFQNYCKLWHLKVNSDKTKIMIFGKGKQPSNIHFIYDGHELEIVKNFKYLGVFFSRKGFAYYNIEQLHDKGIKAMYGAISKCRDHNLSFDCKLDIFDKAIKPIILYGCEVWGFTNYSLLEKLHLKFCKHILKLRNSTPNFMVYGELGRYPLEINVKVRMITFWARLFSSSYNKLSSKLYHIAEYFNTTWYNYIRKILDECGLSYIWQTKSIKSVEWLRKTVFFRLKDQFFQKWKSEMYNSPKGVLYRCYKHELVLENYLMSLPYKFAVSFCKFRTCNCNLPIETGRWTNIPRDERICNLCDRQEIGDEFHYIFNCNNITIKNSRKNYLAQYFNKYPNIYKLDILFNLRNKNHLIKLVKFINVVVKRVSSPG